MRFNEKMGFVHFSQIVNTNATKNFHTNFTAFYQIGSNNAAITCQEIA